MAEVSELKITVDDLMDDNFRKALIRLIDERIALVAPQVMKNREMRGR